MEFDRTDEPTATDGLIVHYKLRGSSNEFRIGFQYSWLTKTGAMAVEAIGEWDLADDKDFADFKAVSAQAHKQLKRLRARGYDPLPHDTDPPCVKSYIALKRPAPRGW